MRFLVVSCVLVSVLFSISAVGAERPILVRVEVGDRAEAREVGRLLNRDDMTRWNVFYGWGTMKEIEAVEHLGYLVEVVPLEPKDIEALTMCSGSFAAPFPWDCYPTWSQFELMMNYYATTYPAIARLVNIGMSGEGDHELWALKISDNPDAEENEPEVLYTATMHGNELVCYGTTVHLIDHILASYGSDPQITRLVNDTVLWINPMSNPDGTFLGGDHTVADATRYLPASGPYFDPNRNFPDPAVPDDPSAPGWAAEIQHMINLAEAEHFTISANCHSGIELFNYPWDVWTARAPDDQWWIDVGIAYATSVQSASPDGYFTYSEPGFDMPGVTNGALWQVIEGGRQDFMNWYHGCREVTLELSNAQPLDADLLDDHFGYNRQALLDYFDLALTGIRGVVTDAVTSAPVAAEIRVVGHDIESHRSWVSTDPDVGDYHRLIEAGTYDLAVSAPGYESATVNGVVVTVGSDATVQDVVLTPLPRYTVTGIVTDATTAAAVPGATVSLVGTSIAPATTNSTGGYAIPDIWEDTYTFRVEAPGYGVVQTDLAVGPGSTTHDFLLTVIVTIAGADFESDDGDLAASDGWEWGTDSTAGAHSGTKVWGTALDENYTSGVQWTLTTTPITLPDADGAELRFWQWYAIEGGYDGGNIKVAVDGGSFNLVTPVPNYNDQTIVGLGDTPGFTGSAGWHEVVVDLTPFAGHSVEIRWTLGTDGSEIDHGWYLDDMTVTAWGGNVVPPPFFADGFESGDTDGWSSVEPLGRTDREGVKHPSR
jgi:Zinc carboxypeptidase/Immune inhibitor A-like, MAM domain/Carboxypeptidase regulatory-like domain